jgi:predicted Rossmann fold flavoprotein
MNPAQTYDAIIAGAGAAGIMCAREASLRGKRVLVLERAEKPGKKILISGGGRCNFTNLHCSPANFLSSNPHFAKAALARYTPSDFIRLVESHGIPYHEKTLGQLFCDRSARDILRLFENDCASFGATIRVNQAIREIRRDDNFLVRTGDAEYQAPALVIATGGRSIPKMGATGAGYDIARQFGLRVVPPRPALVPLTFCPEDVRRYADLAGVSAEVVASFGAASFREKMLFTHRGLSGPAILQISSYWKPGEAISIDLAPGADVMRPLLKGRLPRNVSSARAALRDLLPTRLATRWFEHNAPARFTNAALEDYERRIHRWQIVPAGDEGFDKAEVTAGGVDTAELSSRTFEARRVPGLFFIGEVVDVTGQLGGFNFQWAWSSAFCAAQAL